VVGESIVGMSRSRADGLSDLTQVGESFVLVMEEF